MSYRGFIQDILLDIESDLTDDDLGESVFTMRNRELPCVPDSLMRGVQVESGGKAWIIQFSLAVRRSHFITGDSTVITGDSTELTGDSDLRHPVSGLTITFRGKPYRIVNVDEDPTRARYKLHLADPNSAR